MIYGLGEYFVLLVMMIFAHLIADYTLQGWLAQAKCKDYWADKGDKFKHDYIPALVCHSLMWSIAILIPALFMLEDDGLFVVSFIIPNTIIHCIVDDLKANSKSINLWQDQLLHFAQILVTWGLTIFIVEV